MNEKDTPTAHCRYLRDFALIRRNVDDEGLSKVNDKINDLK